MQLFCWHLWTVWVICRNLCGVYIFYQDHLCLILHMSLTQYGFHMVSVVLAAAGMKFNFLFKYSVQQLPDDRLPQGETALSFQSFFSETFPCICFFKMIIKGISVVFIYLWLLNQLLKQMHLFDFILWLQYFQLTVWYGYNLCAYFMRLVLEFLYLDWQ